MFVIISLTDSIRIPPAAFGRQSKEVLAEEINLKYGNRVLPGLGLVICLVDIDTSNPPFINPGDGGAFSTVTFRLLAFRPHSGEIMEGQVKACDPVRGILVSLDFFDDVIIPPSLLRSELKWSATRGVWTWPYIESEHSDEVELDINIGETVCFRVQAVQYTETARGMGAAGAESEAAASAIAAAAAVQPKKLGAPTAGAAKTAAAAPAAAAAPSASRAPLVPSTGSENLKQEGGPYFIACSLDTDGANLPDPLSAAAAPAAGMSGGSRVRSSTIFPASASVPPSTLGFKVLPTCLAPQLKFNAEGKPLALQQQKAGGAGGSGSLGEDADIELDGRGRGGRDAAGAGGSTAGMMTAPEAVAALAPLAQPFGTELDAGFNLLRSRHLAAISRATKGSAAGAGGGLGGQMSQWKEERVPMVVLGSMQEDGTGAVHWWQEQKEADAGMEEEEEVQLPAAVPSSSSSLLAPPAAAAAAAPAVAAAAAEALEDGKIEEEQPAVSTAAAAAASSRQQQEKAAAEGAGGGATGAGSRRQQQQQQQQEKQSKAVQPQEEEDGAETVEEEPESASSSSGRPAAAEKPSSKRKHH